MIPTPHYKFSASNVFQYVDASGKLATVATETRLYHKSRVGGSLASLKGTPNHSACDLARRAVTYNSCSSTQQSQISTAGASVNSYAAAASSYLDGIPSGMCTQIGSAFIC
jgi:peptidyl-Lys metalloendopeptidase